MDCLQSTSNNIISLRRPSDRRPLDGSQPTRHGASWPRLPGNRGSTETSEGAALCAAYALVGLTGRQTHGLAELGSSSGIPWSSGAASACSASGTRFPGSHQIAFI
ncbi:hypothetical protein C7974DRAFT_379355 [Boeremia exigua]|uniref:uncharacterized protein n=1 Tax=Boeremia exigua TaxID=749465 RepID=UPI001E8EB0E0|nr:uncharacterized protein C7974DRAFT_379355 [Boeremia exigua]KAH6616448.1 hypothetical protein C7974DRAFT_379355 [Boeremia exigua]